MKESLAMKQRDNINVKQRKTTSFMAMSRIKFLRYLIYFVALFKVVYC